MTTSQNKQTWRAPKLRMTLIAEITANNGGSLVDGNFVNHSVRSDRRLKRNVSEVGLTPSGLTLYSFRYNWSEETFVGVMAQEVLEVKPEAVVTNESGYYDVNYSMLDLEMISVDKWRASKQLH